MFIREVEEKGFGSVVWTVRSTGTARFEPQWAPTTFLRNVTIPKGKCRRITQHDCLIKAWYQIYLQMPHEQKR